MHKEASNYKILYITYNKSLTKYAENIINRLYPKKLENLICEDYQSLCKSFFDESDQFLNNNLITLTKFTEKFCKSRQLSNINPVSLWEEIRNLIKGSLFAINTENNIISLEKYLELKTRSCFSENVDFNQVYRLAKQYQQWLEDFNYWDELDLIHYLLNKNCQGKYNEIYCDEIQDLTEIQIHFLIKLLIFNQNHNSLPKIFLTGDPAQVIY